MSSAKIVKKANKHEVGYKENWKKNPFQGCGCGGLKYSHALQNVFRLKEIELEVLRAVVE